MANNGAPASRATTRYSLLATRYSLLATRYSLLATRYSLLALHLAVRQHFDAARRIGGPEFLGLLVPAARLRDIGPHAAHADLGQHDRVVGRPQGERCGRVAGLGGAPIDE